MEITNNNEDLDTATLSGEVDVSKFDRKITKAMNDAKFASFGKVSVSRISKEEKVVEKLQREKVLVKDSDDQSTKNKLKEIDIKLSNALNAVDRKNLERDIGNLQNVKKSKEKSASVFKLRENILGSKKREMEPVVVIDPDTGERADTPEEIKRVSLNYCKKLLTNRSPKPDYEESMKNKYKLHEDRMIEKFDDDIEELS